MITQSRLKEVLYFHANSGDFVWLCRSARNTPVGSLAGTKAKIGYLQIRIAGTIYFSHRLAWLYVYGEWPKGQIDHNQNKSDNRISNLRNASFGQNNYNRAAPVTNTSGFKGVRWYPRYGKFHAQIRADGKRYHLGYFQTLDEARVAWLSAAEKLHGEFAHG